MTNDERELFTRIMENFAQTKGITYREGILSGNQVYSASGSYIIYDNNTPIGQISTLDRNLFSIVKELCLIIK